MEVSKMAVKRSKIIVPVINAETGEKVGQASESDMVGAWEKGNNFHPIIKVNGREYAADYAGDKIELFPSKNIYV